jgi:hypothetical protein
LLRPSPPLSCCTLAGLEDLEEETQKITVEHLFGDRSGGQRFVEVPTQVGLARGAPPRGDLVDDVQPL